MCAITGRWNEEDLTPGFLTVLARKGKPLPPVDRERDPVEERISGEVLAEIRCDQDGHPS